MSRQLLICWMLVSLVSSHTFSQTWNADSMARSIPSRITGAPEDFAHYLKEHFSGEKERVEALFSWLGSNISYDISQVESMSQYESIDNLVSYTLKNKKSVCQGYAEVFTAVCNRMGIQALTVHGYNRIDGRLKTELGHAWNLARIDGRWYLFDPTWGSGYLENGRYKKSFDAFFFMAPPDSLIESHMPFDPIWQLREYPCTHNQFIEGGIHGNIYYNFNDSLNLYYSMDEVGRAESTLRRAEASHANRKEILRMYKKYNDYVINMKCNLEINRYNESSASLRDAIDRFNEYQNLKGKRSPDRSRQKAFLEDSHSLVQQSLLQARRIAPCQSLSIQEIQRLIKQINEVENAVSNSIRSL